MAREAAGEGKMKRWPFFAIVAALACGGGSDGTGPAGVPAISGRFNLASIDGDAPPVSFPTTVPGACAVNILAWSFTVVSATQIASEFTTSSSGPSYCDSQPYTSQGTTTYRQQGALLLFPNTQTDTGTVSAQGQTITIKMLWDVEDDGDSVYIRPVFRKAP